MASDLLAQKPLFYEAFDDASLVERQWYDGKKFRIVGNAWSERDVSNTNGLMVELSR